MIHQQPGSKTYSNSTKQALGLFFGNVFEITTDQLHFHKEDKSFSQEASSLDIQPGVCADTFKITNPKTGNFRIYTYNKIIWQGSGEDREIGGWEYKTDDGLIFTVWND